MAIRVQPGLGSGCNLERLSACTPGPGSSGNHSLQGAVLGSCAAGTQPLTCPRRILTIRMPLSLGSW